MVLKAIKLDIPEVILIENIVRSDERGWFMELWKESSFKEIGIDAKFMQANISMSKSGTLRGLHFQKHPSEQAKLVMCIKGEIFDVAVDIRENSPTFGKYVHAILSGTNFKSIFIPKGFAHGFLVIGKEDAEVWYLADNLYSKRCESGINWNDPGIGIKWPQKPELISKKDQDLPLLQLSSKPGPKQRFP